MHAAIISIGVAVREHDILSPVSIQLAFETELEVESDISEILVVSTQVANELVSHIGRANDLE